MDQTTRNRLRNVVTQCRRLLEESIAQQLQGKYDIYATGKKDEVRAEKHVPLGHLSDEERQARQDILAHFEHVEALGYKPKEALEQLIREIAFTHLNRLCAYKMMEVRDVYVGGQKFREAVSKGLKSQGFLFYLAEHPEDERRYNAGQQEEAYRHFLNWLGGTLSQEIGVLFSPTDPANRVYPPQRVLDEVLDLLNSEELKGIWSEDDTIGWVYQYFTPRELRDQARKESQAPRNSYELAFRNQFFTPRYVVEFLTDNTLGRMWYEMRKGNTKLKDQCRYMVRRPSEVFLSAGEQPPNDAAEGQDDLPQEELLKRPVSLSHRPKKDPREIKVLDPACGSGHFLLYCFALLLVIYEEAYDDPELGPSLQADYPTKEDLRRELPGLILRNNLHGIDIDLRAVQIAGLALWLRCQRAYQEMGLKKDRPPITKSNVVCAEPMPGEKELLDEFLKTLRDDHLEALIRQVTQVPEGTRVRATKAMADSLSDLVRTVWEKMRLASEAGSLLKIEEELQDAIRKGQDEWEERLPLFRFTEYGLSEAPKERLVRFVPEDVEGERTTFWDKAEGLVRRALDEFVEYASNGGRFQRRLFVEDARQGLGFVDVCRQRYDVVLMNPPYGEHSTLSRPYTDAAYRFSAHETYCCFMQRAFDLCGGTGLLGSLTSRTYLTFSTFSDFRRYVLESCCIRAIADLGFGVLDGAMVETAASVVDTRSGHLLPSAFFRGLKRRDKEAWLLPLLSRSLDPDQYVTLQNVFSGIPGAPFCYWAGSRLRRVFSELPSFSDSGAKPTLGLVTGDNDRFLRLRWEVTEIARAPRWVTYCKGGDYSKYYDDPHLLVDWRDDGKHIEQTYGQAVRLRDPHNYFQPGVNYPLVTVLGMNGRLMPCGCIFGNTAPTILQEDKKDLWLHLAFVNTRIFEYLVRLLTSSRHWQVGYLRPVPFPILLVDVREQIEKHAKRCVCIRQGWDTYNETSHLFRVPIAVGVKPNLAEGLCDSLDRWERLAVELSKCAFAIDELVQSAFELGEEFIYTLNE